MRDSSGGKSPWIRGWEPTTIFHSRCMPCTRTSSRRTTAKKPKETPRRGVVHASRPYRSEAGQLEGEEKHTLFLARLGEEHLQHGHEGDEERRHADEPRGHHPISRHHVVGHRCCHRLLRGIPYRLTLGWCQSRQGATNSGEAFFCIPFPHCSMVIQNGASQKIDLKSVNVENNDL